MEIRRGSETWDKSALESEGSSRKRRKKRREGEGQGKNPGI